MDCLLPNHQVTSWVIIASLLGATRKILGFSHIFYTELCAVSAVFRRKKREKYYFALDG
jgi:hypothetical protein